MKKLAAIVLAAVLSFGCAAPAFAAGPYHGVGRCLSYSQVCQGVAQNVLTPGLRSLNERLTAVLGMCAYPFDSASQDASAVPQVDTYATSPSLCANGACEMYLDANADGVCDYHGADCPNMSGGSYVDANGDGACDNYGTYRQGAGNSYGGGTGYGSHHGAGHHGGHHH